MLPAYNNIATGACVPHVAVLVLTMTFTSTVNSSSIFKDGRLKPGIYKIQNIHNDTFVDIEVGSRQMHCRPARDLGEGRGIVRRNPLTAAHV